MEKERLKHLNRKVAISVAIISTFMAVSKVKDDNIVQAMVQAKTDSVDAWNEYQSKKIKQHLTENALTQNESLKLLVPKNAVKFLEDQNEKYRSEVTRYSAEEKELMKKARDLEGKYDSMNFRDDQFDLSDACLSVSLMLLAVTALTMEVWLLWVSWSLTFVGLLMGLGGFMGWKIHPDWLVRLLT